MFKRQQDFDPADPQHPGHPVHRDRHFDVFRVVGGKHFVVYEDGKRKEFDSADDAIVHARQVLTAPPSEKL